MNQICQSLNPINIHINLETEKEKKRKRKTRFGPKMTIY